MDCGQPSAEREAGRGIPPRDDGGGVADVQGSPQPVTPPDPEVSPLDLWGRLKHLILHYILQLDGTPHRIALGVFIGFVIGMTPTIGIQMVSYFAICAITGANRVSGLLPVWVSNPLTAVPLYYFNWKVGVLVMTGSLDGGSRTAEEFTRLIENAPGQDLPLLERITSAEFWNLALDLFIALGIELWVGCLIVGLITGVLGYWATYQGVKAYRRRASAS